MGEGLLDPIQLVVDLFKRLSRPVLLTLYVNSLHDLEELHAVIERRILDNILEGVCRSRTRVHRSLARLDRSGSSGIRAGISPLLPLGAYGRPLLELAPAHYALELLAITAAGAAYMHARRHHTVQIAVIAPCAAAAALLLAIGAILESTAP